MIPHYNQGNHLSIRIDGKDAEISDLKTEIRKNADTVKNISINATAADAQIAELTTTLAESRNTALLSTRTLTTRADKKDAEIAELIVEIRKNHDTAFESSKMLATRADGMDLEVAELIAENVKNQTSAFQATQILSTRADIKDAEIAKLTVEIKKNMDSVSINATFVGTQIAHLKTAVGELRSTIKEIEETVLHSAKKLTARADATDASLAEIRAAIGKNQGITARLNRGYAGIVFYFDGVNNNITTQNGTLNGSAVYSKGNGILLTPARPSCTGSVTFRGVLGRYFRISLVCRIEGSNSFGPHGGDSISISITKSAALPLPMVHSVSKPPPECLYVVLAEYAEFLAIGNSHDTQMYMVDSEYVKLNYQHVVFTLTKKYMSITVDGVERPRRDRSSYDNLWESNDEVFVTFQGITGGATNEHEIMDIAACTLDYDRLRLM